MVHNSLWFKDYVLPKLVNYHVKHEHFADSDFGGLDQFGFESSAIGGEVEFWDSGWVRLTVIDKVNVEWLQRILLQPDQQAELTVELARFMHLLGIDL